MPYMTSHSYYHMVKSLSSKLRNKTRMPTLAASIQPSTGSLATEIQARKRNERHPNQKESKIISACR